MRLERSSVFAYSLYRIRDVTERNVVSSLCMHILCWQSRAKPCWQHWCLFADDCQNLLSRRSPQLFVSERKKTRWIYPIRRTRSVVGHGSAWKSVPLFDKWVSVCGKPRPLLFSFTSRVSSHPSHRSMGVGPSCLLRRKGKRHRFEREEKSFILSPSRLSTRESLLTSIIIYC